MWEYKNRNVQATSIVNKGQGRSNDTLTADFMAADKAHHKKHFDISVLRLIQLITQLCSVTAFSEAILYNEITGEVQTGTLLKQEPFTAVCQ